MTLILTIIAILAPWSIGIALCRWARFGWGASIALGWFTGQAIVMFAGYALMTLRGAEVIRSSAIGMLVIGAAAILIHLRTNHSTSVNFASSEPMTWIERIVLAAFLVSITSKLAAGAASILWNPGRCEDALAYWLFKAKTVTLLGQIQFSPDHPFYLGGSNPKYPIYPSMIAAWIPLVLTEWHESASVIPWLMNLLMLPLAAAFILPTGTPRLLRFIAAHVITSLPLAAIHLFRPGYVDTILASFLLCGAGVLFEWRERPRLGVLLIAGLLLIASACTKREGLMAVIAVIGSLMVCMIFERLQGLRSWRAVGMLSFFMLATGAVAFYRVDLSDISSDAGQWAYHPEAWPVLWRHMFEWSSFSYFFPLAGVATIGLLVFRRGTNAFMATLLCLALFAYAASPFLLTDNVRFALNDQTPSRLLLQIAPAMVVALAFGSRREIA